MKIDRMFKTGSELQIHFLEIRKAPLVYRALNHKLRQQMLKLICRNSKMIVTNIYLTMNIEQSVASQHLGILRSAGIVETERQRKNVFYSVNQERIKELSEAALKLLTQLPG